MKLSDLVVMFVDDQQSVLQAMERYLIRDPYQKVFMTSAPEALLCMSRQDVHIVVTDLKMPEMNGLVFLRHVRELYPATIRMVLSGYTEVPEILGAINSGEVFRYITKPLEATSEFRVTLLQAAELYLLRVERDELLKRLEAHNHEMEEALARVKQLQGLLPICAHCKNIRDDRGYWQQIESYITSHSSAVFSHSLCPECLRKLYPELEKEVGE